MMKVVRNTVGCYDITVDGRTFVLDRMPDTTWQLCETVNNKNTYWQSYRTRRTAIKALRDHFEAQMN